MDTESNRKGSRYRTIEERHKVVTRIAKSNGEAGMGGHIWIEKDL